MNSEPITISGAIGLVVSNLLAMLILFGVALSTEQSVAILAFTNSLVLLAVMIYSRARSTSLANPTIPEGTNVTVRTPEGQDDRVIVA